MVKNSLARHETHFNLWVKKISLRRKWQPTSVFLPGEFHEQRSLEDYSPWRSKELDTPERLHTFTADYTLCCVVLSRSVMSDSLRPHGLQPTTLLCPQGFSRQEYWSGLPIPSPGKLPDPGIESGSPALQADSLPADLSRKPMVTLTNPKERKLKSEILVMEKKLKL